jgi:hypothetical protein
MSNYTVDEYKDLVVKLRGRMQLLLSTGVRVAVVQFAPEDHAVLAKYLGKDLRRMFVKGVPVKTEVGTTPQGTACVIDENSKTHYVRW